MISLAMGSVSVGDTRDENFVVLGAHDGDRIARIR